MSASEIPKELRYAKTHEWVRKEKNGTCVVGITDHAQSKLGDLVYVELPNLNEELKAGEECFTIESVKAASDLFAPVSGTVISVNKDIESTPSLVNRDPYGKGWIFCLQVAHPEEFDNLLTAEEYAEIAARVSHTY